MQKIYFKFWSSFLMHLSELCCLYLLSLNTHMSKFQYQDGNSEEIPRLFYEHSQRRTKEKDTSFCSETRFNM